MSRYDPDNGDPRVLRTRKLILEALIDLTSQRGFASVTVRDITNYAKVNRATFYRHFQDKFDLVDQYVQEVYHLADEPLAEEPSGLHVISIDASGLEKRIAGIARLFEHIRADAKFFRVMLGKNGDPGLAERIRQHIQTRLRGWLPETLLSDKTSAALYLSYVSAGVVGLILWWLENDPPYSPTEVATIAVRLGMAGQHAVLGETK